MPAEPAAAQASGLRADAPEFKPLKATAKEDSKDKEKDIVREHKRPKVGYLPPPSLTNRGLEIPEHFENKANGHHEWKCQREHPHKEEARDRTSSSLSADCMPRYQRSIPCERTHKGPNLVSESRVCNRSIGLESSNEVWNGPPGFENLYPGEAREPVISSSRSCSDAFLGPPGFHSLDFNEATKEVLANRYLRNAENSIVRGTPVINFAGVQETSSVEAFRPETMALGLNATTEKEIEKFSSCGRCYPILRSRSTGDMFDASIGGLKFRSKWIRPNSGLYNNSLGHDQTFERYAFKRKDQDCDPKRKDNGLNSKRKDSSHQ